MAPTNSRTPNTMEDIARFAPCMGCEHDQIRPRATAFAVLKSLIVETLTEPPDIERIDDIVANDPTNPKTPINTRRALRRWTMRTADSLGSAEVAHAQAENEIMQIRTIAPKHPAMASATSATRALYLEAKGLSKV